MTILAFLILNDVFVGWLQLLSESGFAGFKDFQDGGTCDESHDYEQKNEAFLLGCFCGFLRISQETSSPIADGWPLMRLNQDLLDFRIFRMEESVP